MNDQTLGGEPSITAGTTGDTPFGNPNSTTPTPRLEELLDLDEVMSSARLVERTARICLRGDLEAEYHEVLDELAQLVDADGKVLAEEEDQALADTDRAQELADRSRELRAEMQQATRRIRFRAMNDEDWRLFEATHRDAKTGDPKDPEKYNDEIIAACAISPTMTVAQVRGLRSKLGRPQIVAMANAAFWACTTGGLDVPKSPGFLPSPKPPASGKN